MKLSEDDAHKMLWQMAQDHVDEDGKTELEGVNPPDEEAAAAGTWQGDAPTGDTEVPDLITQAPRPGSVPAQVGSAVTAAAPPKTKVDLNQPLGYHPPLRDTELAGLQADAKKRRGEARVGQAVTDLTERPTNFLDYAQRLGGGGVSAAPARNPAAKNYAEEGERAIADLESQRAGDAKLGAAQSAATKTAEDTDPASETAAAWRALLTRFSPELGEQLKGANAATMRQIAPQLEKYVAQQAAQLKAEKAAADRKVQHDADQTRNDAWRKTVHEDAQANADAMRKLAIGNYNIHKGSDERDAQKDAAAAAEKAKGHQTSTSTLTDLADAETAINELGPLGQKFKDLDMSSTESKLSSKATDLFDLQGTDAAEYKATALRAMQGVGKIMEGGKLAAGDEVKYRQMLPRPGDSEQIADQKIRESQSFLRKLKDERITVLRAAGYNVPNVGTPAPAASAAAPAGHGAIVFQGDGLIEYADGHIEEVK